MSLSEVIEEYKGEPLNFSEDDMRFIDNREINFVSADGLFVFGEYTIENIEPQSDGGFFERTHKKNS